MATFLKSKIGGTTPGAGGHDQLNVAGAANLDGKLQVTLIDGFTPNVGDTFEFLTFGSSAGQFATGKGLYGFGDGSKYFDIEPSNNGLQLIVKELPGAAEIKPISPDVTDLMGEIYSDYFSPLTSDQTLSGEFRIASNAYIRGDFTFASYTDETVDVEADGASTGQVDVTPFSISTQDAYLFFGANGPHWPTDENANGVIDQNEIDSEAIGISLESVTFALTLMTSKASDGSYFYAAKTIADNAEFVGVDGFELSAGQISIDLNGGLDKSTGSEVDASVDFSSSFESTSGANDGAFNVPTGNGSVDLDFSGSSIPSRCDRRNTFPIGLFTRHR